MSYCLGAFYEGVPGRWQKFPRPSFRVWLVLKCHHMCLFMSVTAGSSARDVRAQKQDKSCGVPNIPPNRKKQRVSRVCYCCATAVLCTSYIFFIIILFNNRRAIHTEYLSKNPVGCFSPKKTYAPAPQGVLKRTGGISRLLIMSTVCVDCIVLYPLHTQKL